MALGIDLFDPRLRQSSGRNPSYASFAIVRLSYDEREADLLTSDERSYLARLRDSNRSEAQDEDEEFAARSDSLPYGWAR